MAERMGVYSNCIEQNNFEVISGFDAWAHEEEKKRGRVRWYCYN